MNEAINAKIDAIFKEVNTKTKATIEYHGLTPFEGGFLDKDQYVFCHVISANFKALEAIFNEIKVSYGRLVCMFKYTPMSGNMNEIVIEFRFNELEASSMLPAEIISVTKQEYVADDQYHPWCGSSYDTLYLTHVERHYCSKCGKELPSKDAHYCMHCGVEFTRSL